MDTTQLTCPICKMGLHFLKTNKAFICSNNHSFDVARQGYINLLPSNKKKSATPGDSKEMVLARKQFLDKDFYRPISDALNTVILEYTKHQHKQSSTVLDIGCGEGYYLSNLIADPQIQSFNCQFYGLDISKEAVKLAASKCKQATWVVGNSHEMPFIDKGFDVCFSVFSPLTPNECRRVLTAEGILVRILPGTHHLIEMRQLIYPKVILNDEQDPWKDSNCFKTNRTLNVSYPITLTQEELLDLVQMTPHYWKTSKENKEILKTIETLTLTIDMRILIYTAL